MKKGLSDVVTTVLIILIVLASVIIIWNFIRPMIFNSSENIRSEDFSSSFSINPSQVVVQEEEGEINTLSFMFKRDGGDGDLVGIIVIVEDANGKTAVSEKIALSLKQFESSSVSLDSTNTPDLDELSGVSKISVVPVFLLDNGKEFKSRIKTEQTIGSGALVSCLGGQTQNCPLQTGVCAGSAQTCTGGYWPGCSASTYESNNANYESSESSCSDDLDNDCDGSSDCLDSNCDLSFDCIIEKYAVSYWKFDELSYSGANGEVIDTVGNSNGMTYSGALSVSNGKRGRAIKLDGNNDFVEFEVNNANYNICSSCTLNNLTFMMWINVSGFVDLSLPMFSKRNQQGYRGYNFKVAPSGGLLYLFFFHPNINWSHWSTSTFDKDRWHHVALTRNSSQYIKYYIDGVAAGGWVTNSTNDDVVSDKPLHLGEAWEWHEGHNWYSEYFNGTIDEAIVLKKVLSDQEIQAIYNSYS